ncbi:MAG: cytochrome ubiquinol oxidase subunit I [Deltaproteobacteria bacterium]|nr:cytochrome ubiquinol oxidase subunit I [Deltaproteobacteria bacterium]
MDVLILSRLQFAATIYFHFLFVPVTLGMSLIVAYMEFLYVKTDDQDYKRMAQFWGKLFLINFAVGVVTGITQEFQFGTNWSGYSHAVGDIFGPLLAVEATVAFFMESTFIGFWTFGWNKLSKKMHLFTGIMVALGTNLSAFWILMASGWMQHPVGYQFNEVKNRYELTDFFAVLQPSAWVQWLHVEFASWALGGFLVLGISAYHLLRKNEVTFFQKSFRVGAAFALLFSLGVAGMGHFHGEHVAHEQPMKLAAMEAHWETTDHAPMYLLAWPTQEGNTFEALPVPSLLSLMAGLDPNFVVKGLNEVPVEDRPPVLPVYLSFRLMVGLGALMILVGAWAVWKRKNPEENPLLLKVLLYMIPIPWIAILLGWTVTELGRQPWIVTNLLRTEDAVSHLSVGQVGSTLVGFVLIYSLLGAVDWYLLAKYARKGPDAVKEA